uniref:Caveolin n=1 Tax=Eptatretus burgeri TaxID=7764 RepID=A0A8C4NAK7_EPTBU
MALESSTLPLQSPSSIREEGNIYRPHNTSEYDSDGMKKLGLEPHTREIDLINRDPKSLNNDLVGIEFEDVIAEPDSSHSFDSIWKASFTTFTISRYWCYRLLTATIGLPLALAWGLIFAVLSFLHIWAVVPLVHGFLIQIQPIARIYAVYVHAFLDPVFDSMGRCLHHLRSVHHKDSQLAIA